eukprot:COSAG02_NODE_27863_length_601_cov_0.818725_1_plen_27_part_01
MGTEAKLVHRWNIFVHLDPTADRYGDP